MNFYKQLLLTPLALCTISAMAQPSLQKIKSGINNRRITNIERYDINPDKPFMATMLLKKDATVQLSGAKKWLAENMQMRASDELKVFNTIKLNDGFVVEKHQQYYKGIKVEFGMVSFCAKNDNLQMTSMEFYSIPDDFNTKPALTEDQALAKAMEYIGAKKYAWQGYTGTDSLMQKPKGELVIMKDFNETGNKMCLAYKFLVWAVEPESEKKVYVDAISGKPISSINTRQAEAQIGKAVTHYSGEQDIVTFYDPNTRKYVLLQSKDGYILGTKEQNLKSASEYIINTANIWPSVPNDGGAVDVYFNLQVVSDYWKNIHHRKSWDGNGADIISYTHKNDYGNNNAYWSDDNRTLNFGDGVDKNKPFTSLDITAHEFGHAVLYSMSGLKYQDESGALNEGFSNIWAACVVNYAQKNYKVGMQNKNPWLHATEVVNSGINDFENPHNTQQASTYGGKYWQGAVERAYNLLTNGIFGKYDNGGVHTNSGVLDRWFYLITIGEEGTNPEIASPQKYKVAPLTFEISENIAYLTELNLSPNFGYYDVARTSVFVTQLKYNSRPEIVQNIIEAWRAVGIDLINNIYNTTILATNDITSINVDNKSNIYAGTFKQGTYRYNGANWQPLSAVTTGFASTQNATGEVILQSNAIHAIVADNKGGIWIAQSGDNSMTATDGGLEYFPDSSTRIHYGATKGVPTRAVRSVFVDTTRTGADGQPMVWVVSSNTTTGGTLDRGGLGRGVNSTGQPFTTTREGLQTAPGLGYCQTVGGDATEIWVYAFDNYNRSQILRYNAQTTAFIGFYDSTNIGNRYLAKNFQAKSIYFDAHKNKWLGMLNGGLTVLDSANHWHKINFPSIFNDTTYVNDNAIIGDKNGLVYIGTNSGLVVYNGGALDSLSSYTITFNTGALGANIRGMAIDNSKDKLVMATSKGIMYYVCPSCLARDLTVTNAGSGKWSDPATWDNGKVPDSNTNVVIVGDVQVDINGVCNSLRIKRTGQLTIQKGKKLDVISPSSVKYND